MGWSLFRAPEMPNPELERERDLAGSTPEEFAQLEAEKGLRHERLVERHPRLAKLLRVRVEASPVDDAPSDDTALKRVAAELGAEFPHGDRGPEDAV